MNSRLLNCSRPARLGLTGCIVFAGLLLPRAAADQAAPLFTVSSGFDYSRGSYGFDTDTQVFSVPLNLTYESGSWLFRASVPWIQVKGPASVSGGQMGGVPGRPTTASESGMGDVTVSGTYRAGIVFDSVHLDLTGRVKLPTASETKGLGTGELDHYWQADFYRRVGDVVPFGTVGYRFMGSSPRYPLRNGAYLAGGLVYHTSAYTSLGLSFDWRQRVLRGGPDARELTGFLVHRFDDRWSLQTYALTGFSDASPDFGGGALLNYRY